MITAFEARHEYCSLRKGISEHMEMIFERGWCKRLEPIIDGHIKNKIINEETSFTLHWNSLAKYINEPGMPAVDIFSIAKMFQYKMQMHGYTVHLCKHHRQSP